MGSSVVVILEAKCTIMEIDINKKLISAVLENIPKNLKPAIYLTDLLRLSRESTYRRIRSEIPFTFEEIAKISVALNISIDNVIFGNSKDYASFEFISNGNASSNFHQMLQKTYVYIEGLSNAHEAESIVALNCLPPTYAVFYDNLFKFIYYKSIHQENDVLKTTFSETKIPPETIALQKKIYTKLKKINNSTLILDPTIFLSLIKDIEYYYQRKLLNKEDFNLLINDMERLINMFEEIAHEGIISPNAHVSLYLSTLSINTNSGYLKYDGTVKSVFWVFPGNPILIFNSELCDLQKRWLIFLKRQSTLISQSNEILQMEFFDKQKEYFKKNSI
jgi:hypothetical protein